MLFTGIIQRYLEISIAAVKRVMNGLHYQSCSILEINLSNTEHCLDATWYLAMQICTIVQGVGLVIEQSGKISCMCMLRIIYILFSEPRNSTTTTLYRSRSSGGGCTKQFTLVFFVLIGCESDNGVGWRRDCSGLC